MAKRGRKPKNEKKGYFYEEQEKAFVDYLSAEDKVQKNKIFNECLLPALTKMIESIIRRYKLYPPDEDFNETFDETISFLITKIQNFNPNLGYKAYSYCGTVCKNHLIHKINQKSKEQKRYIPYDNAQGDIEDNIKYSYAEVTSNNSSLLDNIIKNTIKEINKILENKNELKLTENQVKVGLALVELFNNWEELFPVNGSNKFNKSSILLFLKEATSLDSKTIRDNLKIYKVRYFEVKNKIIENY